MEGHNGPVSVKMKLKGLFFLLVCSASAFGDICKPVDRLQAVSQSYKISRGHAMFGRLGACRPAGEQLDQSLEYHITDASDLPGVNLLDSRTGEFSFEPAPNFVGVVSFTYTVSDGQGRTSPPAKVTVQIRCDPAEPLLALRNISAVAGSYAPLGVGVSVGEGQDGRRGELTVTLCNCEEDFECHRDTGRCYCVLTLPRGWEMADGLRRRLAIEELQNLPGDRIANLTLKTQVNSAGQHCVDVHATNWNTPTETPLSVQRKLLITISPAPASTTGALQLETSEGRVVQFKGLRVGDSDSVTGTYRVRVSLDRGGTLWVKQDDRSDVIFFPKESDSVQWAQPTNHNGHRKLDRSDNFYDSYLPYNTQATNNGKKQLSFVGSLEGIRHILTSMVFVPWCPHWPTPPNWNLPESSWMDPSNHDQLLSDDSLRPAIWPQWYPRFWYPFPRKSWNWWPRVLPPWWLNQTCSDWISHVHLDMREVTPETCNDDDDDTETDVDRVQWDADIHVRAQGSQPKSLITDNLFTYFSPSDTSFTLENVYIRSKEEIFQLRFTLEIVEKQLGTIENTDTNKPSFTCTSVPDCNDKLQKIQVHLNEGTEMACHVTIEIRMYQDDSDRLSDYMMLWAYKTRPECTNYLYNDPNATVEASQQRITMWQGETAPLDLRYSSLVPDRTGILHIVIHSYEGLVTVSAPDGLRVYMDHMGHHDRIPTYLCISGPTRLVLDALLSAKFTPFKNFKGEATVEVNYTVPYTALFKTYGIATRPLTRLTVVTFEVVSGDRPYSPLLEMPSKVCMSETDLLPLDMMRVEGRYQEDEAVTLSIVALKGSLIVEQSRIAELYGCPDKGTGTGSGACIEECSFHTACPGTQMCCYQGCDRVCTVPQQVATIESHTPQNVNIHGNISTINSVLEAENMWYLAKPCQTDDAGEIVTDRVIETQEDALRIRIVPARNTEGESVLGTLFVQISCTPPMVEPIAPAEPDEEGSSDCREEWGAWLDCQVTEGVCGRGSQVRQGRCGPDELRQERPCMSCGCEPVWVFLADPSFHLMDCVSEHPVKQCPAGCDTDSHRTEVHDFQCTDPSPNEDHGTPQGSVVRRTKTIEVHDSCICSACLTHE